MVSVVLLTIVAVAVGIQLIYLLKELRYSLGRIISHLLGRDKPKPPVDIDAYDNSL
ncbi:MAG: hypothetical protein UX08_C0007G0089 [Candidatus Collierbacteria bacterium GW2011_GWB1_45_35]|nr:MAG: hypothetical protein UX08_C0007G0089 [Candidatus Collierbacteria bacterium GW2011_GWB1_45_35]